jgi:hypothetical protein
MEFVFIRYTTVHLVTGDNFNLCVPVYLCTVFILYYLQEDCFSSGSKTFN